MNRKVLLNIMSIFFVLLLTIPCLGLFREKRNIELIALMENRTINPMPQAEIFSGKFFNEFSEWYNDRLLGRKDLIRFWSSVNGKLFNTLISKEIVLGKDGFLFFPSGLSDRLVDSDEKIRTLNQINDICKANNSNFVVFLAPPSEWIFGDLLSDKYKPVDLVRLEKETGELFQSNEIDYCFIASDMAELTLNERKSMFYAGDSHWNKKGGYFGAYRLLKHLKLDCTINNPIFFYLEPGFGDIYTKKIGWEPIKSMVEVPWSETFSEEFIVKANISNELVDGIVQGASQKGEVIYINNNVNNKVKVLILGDSFFSAMSKYLLQDMHTIIFSHNCDVSLPKTNIEVSRMIEYYKPDIVVYEKVASSFYGHNHNTVFDNMKM